MKGFGDNGRAAFPRAPVGSLLPPRGSGAEMRLPAGLVGSLPKSRDVLDPSCCLLLVAPSTQTRRPAPNAAGSARRSCGAWGIIWPGAGTPVTSNLITREMSSSRAHREFPALRERASGREAAHFSCVLQDQRSCGRIVSTLCPGWQEMSASFESEKQQSQ